MISVTAKDRAFLCFLWIDDPINENPSVVAYQFTRVVLGVTASFFLLNTTVRHHLELHSETHGELVSKVLRSIYVDDIMTGSQTEEQAYQLYTGVKTLLKTGVFNLRKLSTNVSSLQARSDSEESVYLSNTAKSNESMEKFSQATLS